MKPTRLYPAKSNAPSFASFPPHITAELHRYEAYLRDVRGLAAETRKNRLRVVGLLLRDRFERCAIDFRKVRPDDVRQFLSAQLRAGGSASYASHLAATLRSYLRYRTVCGDQPGKLSTVILNPVHWKLASLPRALKPEEVIRLLGAVAGARRWPKRSYAMVRLALDMGLRSGEIAHLMIRDIDWREGTVTLRGTKSLRQDVMPLPMACGQALADYLQHERPATSHPALFVRRVAGRDQPVTSTAVQKVIKRACSRSGLLHSSAHALRHTLACRLVENGSSLKEVADLLRHRSLNTTLIYAKLDTPKLSAVALPWPGSQS
ncbi:site-specific integrase (plasmid) [Paraburkholderia sprentiae WSM5005]|uniref:Site-specific integrase n=2 Tax=Paraburkholderia sprentiae WSM5005 TaxID=754502 RepID=A0A1I9YVW1_9BURK|nr:tyrosine-type recombinase/integrase [Paraburkholderia sprentiae]APA90356.1 site-specific integrase [Paraburkholderia sprentiae WSM5005]APA90461.1 site-specific integrase [Paraburkholderia sprentiae WSM5005]